MKEYVKFRDRDYEYGFCIYSHYTTILGLDSGEGKTWLFDSLSERYNEGIVKIEANYPVIFANSVNLLTILKTEDRSVVFVDEISINKNSQYLGMVNSSKHFIVRAYALFFKRVSQQRNECRKTKKPPAMQVVGKA